MSSRESGRTPAHAPGAPARGPASASAPSLSRSPRADAPDPGTLAAVPSERLTVRADEPPEHLFRRLLSAYLRGARRIEVVEVPRVSAASRAVVREFCRRTRQPEVVQDDDRRLELVELDDGTSEELDERLRRLGERVLDFHREAVESWGRLSFADEGLWSRKDDEVDREAWYLERCIAQNGGDGRGLSRWAIGAWTVTRSLERIADHAVTLGEVGSHLADLGPDTSLLRELRQFHRQAMAHLEEVLRSPDGSRANDLLDVGEALLAGGRALTDRLLPAVGDGSMVPVLAVTVSRALEAVGRTLAYSQDIAQAFLDRAAGSSETERAPALVLAGTVGSA